MGKKLFLSTLAIVLLTLILSMLSVHYVFKKEFSNYLTHTTEAALEPLPQRLLSAYNNNTWDIITLERIGGSLPLGTQVTLQDLNGHIITTLENSMEVMHENMGLGDSDVRDTLAGLMNMPYSVQGWKTKTITIANAQKTIATAIIRYPSSARILNPEDISFTTSVFYSLITASGLALLIGISLVYFTRKQLVAQGLNVELMF